MSTSIMTNTAFDIARRLEEDAKPLLDKQEGAEIMLQKYWWAICQMHGEEESAK